jgi:hypothetical protein
MSSGVVVRAVSARDADGVWDKGTGSWGELFLKKSLKEGQEKRQKVYELRSEIPCILRCGLAGVGMSY